MNYNILVANYWFKLNEKIRFILIGTINTIISYGIFCIIFHITGSKYHKVSLLFSWLITSIIAFFTQKILVFQTTGNLSQEYIKTILTRIFGFTLNLILLNIFLTIINNVYFAQFLANLTNAVISFFILKYFAFKK